MSQFKLYVPPQHVSPICKPNLCCLQSSHKSFSLFFGAELQLTQLLHAVTVTEVAMTVLAYAKLFELDLL